MLCILLTVLIEVIKNFLISKIYSNTGEPNGIEAYLEFLQLFKYFLILIPNYSVLIFKFTETFPFVHV
jgi:hypothetical protein